MSIVVPVRNEAGFIASLLAAILGQDYPPDRMEVIVADGMSTDGTREIVERMAESDSRVTVIDNPRRVVPPGLNAAIRMARGDLILRIDGHVSVAPDYVRQNVELFREHPEAWSVGGPIRHVASTTFGKAVAVAMEHRLGVGNALHRFPDYEGYAEEAPLPAFRRWVFERVGMFDERLIRNQDDEFNYRIHQAGGKVYISPRVRYSYFVRAQPAQLFKQYFQYGFWRIPVIEKHRRPTTARQVVPALFYLLVTGLAVAGVYLEDVVVASALPVVYASILASAGVSAGWNRGPKVAACVPVAMVILHAGYAAGMIYGAWARVFRADAWRADSSMASISR